VPHPLKTLGDPFTLGRSFDEDARLRMPGKHLFQTHSLSFDPLFNQFIVAGEDANLTADLVNVDTDVVQTDG